MKTDIVVVGSGIAASAAMIRLQQLGLSATQIAPVEKSSDRIGETLSYTANQLLKQLQLWEAFLARGYLAQDLVFSAWDQPTLTRQSRFSRSQGSTWSIDRDDFEDFLRMHSANDRHHRLFKKIKTCSQTTDGLLLDIDDHLPLQAGFVIDCSGRSAIIGRRLSRRHRIDNMICYYSFIKQSDTEIEPTVGIMIEAVENGWWYSAILPDRRMIISFYTYPDLVHQHLNRDAQSWRSLIDQAPLTQKRIESAGYCAVEAPLASDAGMLMQSESSGRNWISAGDAFATLDPLSSHGMTQALWSGCRAAEACMNSIHGDHSEVDKFEQTVTQAMQAYQTELITKYQSVKRFARYPFWERRGSLDFRKKSA
ncbi:MAG: hypothetical protein RLY91_293 [Pseudomonadota bacterium]|jgi:flavin-dependent dehydrogenase